MQTKDFNLVHNPWINALYMDGVNQYVSLKQLFQDWNEIACINGTNTRHTIGINRLLQLILMKVSGGFETTVQFKEHWDDQQLGNTVAQYLEANAHLFTLGSEEHPCLQAAVMRNYIEPDKFNTFAVQHQSNKDLTFTYKGTQLNPPTYTPIEVAQFLVSHNFLAPPGLGDRPEESMLKGTGMTGLGDFNGCSGSLYYNSITVSIAGETLRETLLLNLPKQGLNGTEVAPWERIRQLRPEDVVPETPFEALSILTRSVLLLWDKNGELSGVYAGPGDKIALEVNKCMPQQGLLPAFPSLITQKDEIIYPSPNKNQPLWKDISLIFSLSTTGAKGNMRPAPIVKWWEKLARAGLMPETVSYEVTNVISMGKDGGTNEKALGVIAAATINSVMLPHSIFTNSDTGKDLFNLFKLITDLHRTLFLVNTAKDANGARKDLNSSPLALMRKYGGFFSKGQNWALQMLSKYPVGAQFLTLAESLFMEALADAAEDPTAFKAKVNQYQDRILALAKSVWATTINSVPLVTPSYFRAAGYAQSQFNRTLHFYKKPLVGTNNEN